MRMRLSKLSYGSTGAIYGGIFANKETFFFFVNLVLTLFNFFSKVSFKLSYFITSKPLSSRVRSDDEKKEQKKIKK